MRGLVVPKRRRLPHRCSCGRFISPPRLPFGLDDECRRCEREGDLLDGYLETAADVSRDIGYPILMSGAR